MYAGILDAGSVVTHDLGPGRHAWIQIARGTADLNGIAGSRVDTRLEQGDGAAATGEEHLEIRAETSCELLLFDLG